MTFKYTMEGGKPKRVARIYSASETGVDNSKISPAALRIIARLTNKGHIAYIVGGAVRDIINGIPPKDFDIATSATPREAKKALSNARIIGRRFKIVLARVDGDEFEITSFRRLELAEDEDPNNAYGGTMEEDFQRRDFTVNALYYDPATETVIDYCSGLDDIRRKVLRAVLPLETIFTEDPVRMIRAIKTSIKADLTIDRSVSKAIKRSSPAIATASHDRLTEEIKKILDSGMFLATFDLLYDYGLMGYIIPCLARSYKEKSVREALFVVDGICSKYHSLDVPCEYSQPLTHLVRSLVDLSPLRAIPHEARYKATKALVRDTLGILNFPVYIINDISLILLKDANLSYTIEPKKKKRNKKSAPVIKEGT